jgi:NAD(P)-dependent dehydrogenase (short-subunit alcohol dehydrogenase family)
MKLKGINALITGASQGLGREIAAQFLREGANVVLCARSEKDLFTTRSVLAGQFPSQKILAETCDVSNESEVNALTEFALRELSSLHALVLNAGIYGPKGPTESVSLEEWRRAMDINLYGVLLPCRALIPHFKKAGRGKIVVLSGGGATNPMPNISAYATSKAAAVRLMETLAEELKPFHVDVNAIAPGALATRLVDEVLAAGPEKVGQAFYEKNRQWKEKGATPLELGAGLAVYLASAASDGITGKLLSAQWDPWERLHEFKNDLNSDIYTLRRIVPKDRGKTWGDK